MKLTDLHVGLKLELEVYNRMEERTGISLISQFERAEDENTALIAAPIHQGILYPMSIGTLIDVLFFHKNNLYRFNASVEDRYVSQNLSFIKIRARSEIKRIQRRQFYRLKCLLPIKYRVIGPEEQVADEKVKFLEAYIKDISGGGVCMLVEENLGLHDLLECILLLKESIYIKFTGEVIRMKRCESDASYKYEVGVKYKKIEHKDRETIIAYIFQEQRKLRGKGLI